MTRKMFGRKENRVHTKKSPLLRAVSVGVLFFFIFAAGFTLPAAAKTKDYGKIKNVIMMVYDGQGPGVITLARWLKRVQDFQERKAAIEKKIQELKLKAGDAENEGIKYLEKQLQELRYKNIPLAMDYMKVRLCSTFMANSVITGSAAAATAFATGHKTLVKHVAVLPKEDEKVKVEPFCPGIDENLYGKPVATLLEGAKHRGKATGIISTSQIQHATPACFSAHWPNRSNYEIIAEQQVYLGIDVVLGGGYYFLMPKQDEKKEKSPGRNDGQNLVEIIKEKYCFIKDLEGINNLDCLNKKTWGMFDAPNRDFAGYSGDLYYDLDRKYVIKENIEMGCPQPSICEMTDKAIKILSKNEKGFFLMVEGSKVDWASHQNEPVGVIYDFLAFDEAVAKALEWADKLDNTLVVVFPDHDNGGLTMGNRFSDSKYKNMLINDMFKYLAKAKLTGEGVCEKFHRIMRENGKLDAHTIVCVIKNDYAICNLVEPEVEKIKEFVEDKFRGKIHESDRDKFMQILGEMMSWRSYLGWTTGGHIGNDVPLHFYGPEFVDFKSTYKAGNNPRRLVHLDNTDIAKNCASLMGFDLDEVTKSLFQEMTANFDNCKGNVSCFFNNNSKDCPVLVLENSQGKRVEIPAHRNYMTIYEKNKRLRKEPFGEGIAVYVPHSKKFFVPAAVLQKIKKYLGYRM